MCVWLGWCAFGVRQSDGENEDFLPGFPQDGPFEENYNIDQ